MSTKFEVLNNSLVNQVNNLPPSLMFRLKRSGCQARASYLQALISFIIWVKSGRWSGVLAERVSLMGRFRLITVSPSLSASSKHSFIWSGILLTCRVSSVVLLRTYRTYLRLAISISASISIYADYTSLQALVMPVPPLAITTLLMVT